MRTYAIVKPSFLKIERLINQTGGNVIKQHGDTCNTFEYIAIKDLELLGNNIVLIHFFLSRRIFTINKLNNLHKKGVLTHSKSEIYKMIINNTLKY